MTRIFLLSFLLVFGAFVPPAFAEMEDYPTVKLQALDKSTARTVTFEANVGKTIEYGSLFIKIQACRKSGPLEKPESAAFLQIWEVPINAEKSEWIFSGWMFASSPALSAMDHPVYDVWVLDCLDKERENREALESQTRQQTADQQELAEPVKTEDAPAAETPATDDDEPHLGDALDEDVDGEAAIDDDH